MDEAPLLSRRALLARALALGSSAALVGACGGEPVPPPAIGWQPDIFAPVFYGWQELGTAEGAPGRLRVWYPSLEGSPAGAPVLSPTVGRSPLVVFLHGECDAQDDHYRTWSLLPAQLARSGYVVAVPDLPGIRTGQYPWESGEVGLVVDVIDWMREGWAHRAQLMPAPATALAGHSYGALLAARIAATAPAKAYVSIAGVWSSWPSSPPRPLGSLGVPSLFMWGDNDLSGELSSLWDDVLPPKHRVRFRGGTHFDHWRTYPPETSPCEPAAGPCRLVGSLTADFTTTFLSRYLPPEGSGIGSEAVPVILLQPPPEPLTDEQRRYAGAHLTGFARLDATQQPVCRATHTWQTSAGGGTITIPNP